LPDKLIDCEGNDHDVPWEAQLRFEIKPEALVEAQSWMRNLGLPPTQDASQHQDYSIFSRVSLYISIYLTGWRVDPMNVRGGNTHNCEIGHLFVLLEVVGV